MCPFGGLRQPASSVGDGPWKCQESRPVLPDQTTRRRDDELNVPMGPVSVGITVTFCPASWVSSKTAGAGTGPWQGAWKGLIAV